MKLSKKTLAVLALLSALGFGALIVLSEMFLSVGGGLLDGRLNGYDAEAVNQYLRLLPEEGLNFYLGPFRTLDTIVPLLLGFTFIAMIWSLGAAFWRLTIVLPIVYALADLRENALVGQILKTGEGNFDAATVACASDMTQLKWLFTALSLGVVVWLWRKARVKS